MREICDKYDVLLVSDEVICAFGRIGHMFACDAYGYVPDMITCAKAHDERLLADRRARSSATGSTSRSATATTSFYHGYTFGGHPVSAAVALENLDIFEEEGLNEHVRENSPVFRVDAREAAPTCRSSATCAATATSSASSSSRTRRRRRPSTTTSPSGCCAASCRRRCSTPGLYCRADDRGDPVIQLAPPLTIGPPEFDEIERILRGVLTEAWTRL